MKYFGLYLWILFFPLKCWAGGDYHKETIDSLVMALARENVQINQVDILNQMGWEYRYYNPDSAIYFCSQAIQLAHKIGYIKGKILATNYIGVAYMIQLEHVLAMEYFDKALYLANENNDSLQVAHSYHNMGKVFFAKADYLEAYQYFEKALVIFEESHNKDGTAYVFQSLSKAYMADHNTARAMEMAEASLRLREEINNIAGQVNGNIELGYLMKEVGRLQEAKALFEKARLISEKMAREDLKARAEIALANIHLQLKKPEIAIIYARQAESKLANMSGQLEIIQVQVLLAEIYTKMGNYQMAKDYLSMVSASTASKGAIAEHARAMELFSELYEKQGQYEQSLGYHKQYLFWRDSAFNLQKIKEFADLARKHRQDREFQELELLKSREADNRETVRQQKQANLMLTGLMLTACLGLAVVVYMYLKQQATNRLLSEQSHKIAEQHKAMQEQNQALQQVNQSLEVLNQEKDSLMGIVAHDLKSPLNKVQGFVQILRLVGGLSAEQKTYIDGIAQAAESGRNLIRDLLDVHAFEYSKMNINIEEVELSSMVEKMLKGYGPAAIEKGLQMQFYAEPTIIYSEASSLQRILENLISNAVKFSPREKNIYITIEDEGDEVRLVIKDEGPGFTSQDQDKAFSKFQKLSAKPTGGESSTGLGLAIVKALTEKLQGRVTLDTAPGEGATFELVFPKKMT